MKKIKEMLNRFGILVIRAIWPVKGKGGAQKMGLVILALTALLGVTQASSLREMFLGHAKAEAKMQPLKAAPITQPKLATSNQILTDDPTTTADTTVGGTITDGSAPNIVDLIGDSQMILRGSVKEVTDGFDNNGVPYTQVTFAVDEAIRGQVGDEYTFRQFGLIQPRSMGNGKVYIGTTPAGWSKYSVGDNAVLFLYQPASLTGLQTTTGLEQGKVDLQGGNAISQAGNEGLFDDVDVNQNLLNDKDKRLLATKKGAVNAEGFLSFVRRAVDNKWVEGGKLRHAKK